MDTNVSHGLLMAKTQHSRAAVAACDREILNRGEMTVHHALLGEADRASMELAHTVQQRYLAMSRLSIVTFALICGLGFSAMAAAQSSTPLNENQASYTSQPSLRATADGGVIKPGDRNCLRHTGSLIPARKGECLPVVGRSYSGEELRRTGTPDTARALQMLDPSISVGH
jgi:hypothetical protein